MLAGLLLFAPGISLGLEERMIIKRVGKLVSLDRPVVVQVRVSTLQREVFLDHGSEQRTSFGHYTYLGRYPVPSSKADYTTRLRRRHEDPPCGGPTETRFLPLCLAR